MISLNTGNIANNSSMKSTATDKTAPSMSIEALSQYKSQTLQTSPLRSKACNTPSVVLPEHANRVFSLEKA